METTERPERPDARLLNSAMLLVAVGLVFLLLFLIAGFQSWSVGIGMFMGFPLLMLGMILYIVYVIRDLYFKGVFDRTPASESE